MNSRFQTYWGEWIVRFGLLCLFVNSKLIPDDKMMNLLLHFFFFLFFEIVPGRVRVAVRLRPRNAEELVADADFADCVELQPEVLSTSLFLLYVDCHVDIKN